MPWVGAEYPSGGIFGKRILVLGESHYGDGEPSADTTARVFEEYFGCPGTVPPYLQSFKRFERSLTGTETDPPRQTPDVGLPYGTPNRNKREPLMK